MKHANLENDINITDVKFYEHIIGMMPGHVYWKNRHGVLLGCNDRLAKTLRLPSRQAIVGKTDDDITTQEEAEAIRKIDLDVMQTKHSRKDEENYILPDGTQAIYITERSPILSKNNEVMGILGISIDVTKEKQAEAREKAAQLEAAEARVKAQAKAKEETLQAMTILVGSIVHDLRTPIATLGLMGSGLRKFIPILAKAYQLAREAKLPVDFISPQQVNALLKIAQNVEETAHEMNRFITITLKMLANVLAGTSTPEDLLPCSINDCVNQVVRRYPYPEQTGNLVHWKETEDFIFAGNQVFMFTVLSNLMKNSLEQISLKKRGEVFLHTEKSEGINRLYFRDTAGGAAPEIVAHLFDGYKSTKEGGTGVGLTYCKRMMLSFGGNITCHSVEGDYIEFVLSFPEMKKST